MNLDNFKSLRSGPGVGRGEREATGSGGRMGDGMAGMVGGAGSGPGAASGTGAIDMATFRLALVHELRAPLQVLQEHLDALCAEAERGGAPGWAEDDDPDGFCDSSDSGDSGDSGGPGDFGDPAGQRQGNGRGEAGGRDHRRHWGVRGERMPGSVLASVRERFGAMRNMLDVVASAVDDVLHLGQSDVPQLPLREAAFEVRVCLDEEVSWFAPKARTKGLDLACSIADDVPVMLHGDAARLRQILRVLLDNALKYTVCGGVAVVASWTAVEASVAKDGDGRMAGQTSGLPSAGRLALDVVDSGPGVPAGMENAVFSAFSRVDRETPGAGLGLWIAQQWAERLGGVLRVEPSSTGARFHLCVPFAPIAPVAPPPTTGAPAPWPPTEAGEAPVVHVGVRHGLRAMVVDDHVMNRAMLAEQLGALGCEVHRAADFTEALLQWITDDFDVVLTDIQLGESSGLTLAKSLHALGPVLARQAPVVLAVTGSVVSARAAREGGLDGVLTKPVSRQRLTQALAARWPSFGEAGDADGPDRAGAASSPGGTGTALRDDPYARRLMRDEMAKDLARFRRLLAGRREGDLMAAQEVVHRMRGACRMFGDPVLIARCDQLAGKLAERLAARCGALDADDQR